MKIKTIASGSSGNCYLIQSLTTNLLLEAGVKPQTIKDNIDIKLSQINGILLSHRHKDHSEFAEKLASDYGVKIYANSDTLSTFTDKYIETEEIYHKKSFYIGGLYITPLKVDHDVECYAYIIVDVITQEKLFFFTDTSKLNYELPQFDYIMGECNYDDNILIDNLIKEKIDRTYANRVRRTHFSLESFANLVKTQKKLKKIYLLHLSDANSNEREFIKTLQGISGVPVEVC